MAAKTYGRTDTFEGDEIEWGEPPEAGSRKVGVWATRLSHFKDKPGEWGKIPGYWPSPVAANIKKGEYTGVEPGEFEATTRIPDPADTDAPGDTVEIWVRFVG